MVMSLPVEAHCGKQRGQDRVAVLEGQPLEEAPRRDARRVPDLAPIVGEAVGQRLYKHRTRSGEVVSGEHAADGADDVVRDLPYKAVGVQL